MVVDTACSQMVADVALLDAGRGETEVAFECRIKGLTRGPLCTSTTLCWIAGTNTLAFVEACSADKARFTSELGVAITAFFLGPLFEAVKPICATFTREVGGTDDTLEWIAALFTKAASCRLNTTESLFTSERQPVTWAVEVADLCREASIRRRAIEELLACFPNPTCIALIGATRFDAFALIFVELADEAGDAASGHCVALFVFFL